MLSHLFLLCGVVLISFDLDSKSILKMVLKMKRIYKKNKRNNSHFFLFGLVAQLARSASSLGLPSPIGLLSLYLPHPRGLA
jgi:hypothetical protein